MPAFKDLSGEKLGRLRVVKGKRVNGLWRWLCKCSCGSSKWIAAGALTRRDKPTRSCGCLNSDAARKNSGKLSPKYKHGHSVSGKRSAMLSTWESMIRRCHDKSDTSYPDYGGRGIKVCDRWQNSFKAFLEDMGKKPTGTSIDRIDNDAGYSPGNCRWATPRQQNRNTRRNILVRYRGRIVTLADFAEMEGVNYYTAHSWASGKSNARKLEIVKGART